MSEPPCVNVTNRNAQGGTEQRSGMACPWSQSYQSFRGFVYISAQNQADHGSLTVRIVRDGAVAKESSCEGAYCIASASGRL